MLTLQYEIYEQMEDEQGQSDRRRGHPVMAWIKPITFNGVKSPIRQL